MSRAILVGIVASLLILVGTWFRQVEQPVPEPLPAAAVATQSETHRPGTEPFSGRPPHVAAGEPDYDKISKVIHQVADVKPKLHPGLLGMPRPDAGEAQPTQIFRMRQKNRPPQVSEPPRRGSRSHHHRRPANESLPRNITQVEMKAGWSTFKFGTDSWSLPNLTTLDRTPYKFRRLQDLKSTVDFGGHLVDYGSFPPLRLNLINGRNYLVYIYVNQLALEAAINLIVSARRYDIKQVLLLCENPGTASILAKAGLYHYYPRDLVENMNQTLRGEYWGPSMWVRCNFNHHMVTHGISVAFFDADIVLLDDPRPVLFTPGTQLSTSFRMSSYGPWVWSFPFLNREPWTREPTLAAALNRHFLELNNGLSRYDATDDMLIFFEFMKDRIMVEVRKPKDYPGWDQTAQARVLNDAGYDFRSQPLRRFGNEYALISEPTALNITAVLFQTVMFTYKERLDLSVKGQRVPHFAYHAYGHVRSGPATAWYVKLAYIHGICWTLSPGTLARFRRWNTTLGEDAFWMLTDNGTPCCMPECNSQRSERSEWDDSLLSDYVPLTALPKQFRQFMIEEDARRRNLTFHVMM